MTFGPSTRKVQEFYMKVGLQISKDYTELPDYIGLELACMEYLCAREAELNSGSREMENVCNYQKQFLTEHLVCWVPHLCQRIKKNAQTRFYRDLAETTEEFVMHDEHRFG
jgi:TorA maturation chaperone TorD